MFECDFAILTIVDEARDAAVELFDITPQKWEERLGLTWGVAMLPASDGGQHIVVVGKAVDRSNGPAFDAAEAMLRAWRPRHLVIADIAGGFWGEPPNDRDGLALGDVIVANDIEYFEVEKQVRGGKTKSRRYAIQLPSTGPRNALGSMQHRIPDWYQPAQANRPIAAAGSYPKLLDGQIVCGEKLLSNPNSMLVARLSRTYDKALGFDMESAGVGRAVLARQREGIFAQFTVLRGVSDFINKRDEANQKTRDDWKPYAARVAVAAAKAWILASPTGGGVIATGGRLSRVLGGTHAGAHLSERTIPNATAETGIRYVERLRDWLKEAAQVGDRTFRLKLQATPHRSAISVAPTEGKSVERGDLLGLAMRDRKVVIVGPSGAGKSILLRQILRQVAVQDDPLVVHVDLKENWRSRWARMLSDLPDEKTIDTSMNALLTASALAPSGSELAQLAAGRSLVLIVDALNEVPADVGEKIRIALDQYVRFHDSVCVLASDRRTEQFYRESRWTVLHLAGVTDDEARDVVDEEFGDGTFDSQEEADRRLLVVPFFLDRALQSHRVRLGSRASAVGDFLRDAGFQGEEIDRTARYAFALYERGEPMLNSGDIVGLEAGGLLDKLRGATVVIEGASGPIFAHQLVHQFLAGHHLGSTSNAWTAETLDSVTAQAASLEAVAMTIAAIAERDERDRFLRIVYDWNWRAAVSALIETQAGDRQVSDALATAVLAMAAEKRFDAVGGTRDRVEGLLREVPGPIAQRMRALTSHEDLMAEIGRTEFAEAPWWAPWREVFVWNSQERGLTDQEVAAIGSSEPLMGWTVANSLRRFARSERIDALLRMVYRSQLRGEIGARTTRWRVVHAFGTWPSHDNAEFLFEAFDDPYAWVVYGAVRSLVEMAALTRDHDLRSWIVEQLKMHWRRLPPAPRSQLAWTAVYRDSNAAWPEVIRPLLEIVRSHQTGGERERWDRRLERFEAYSRSHTFEPS